MQFGERYDILRQIGRGTTASVFLVRDKHLDKKWVAKVFAPVSQGDIRNNWLIQNEIDILKSLKHQCMPRAVDLYREAGGTYLIMDYIEGVTLKTFVQKYGAMSEPVVLSWMMDLCQLLNVLHTMEPRIIYCDLKPENIIIQNDGNLALIDFGSARIPSMCEKSQCYLTGTEMYTAPELFEHGGKEALLPKADVYSIGAVGFYAASGMDPANREQVLWGNTKSFRQLILKCMEKKTERLSNCDILSEKILKLKKEKRD